MWHPSSTDDKLWALPALKLPNPDFESSNNLRNMFLECVRKSEYPVNPNSSMWRTCKLHPRFIVADDAEVNSCRNGNYKVALFKALKVSYQAIIENSKLIVKYAFVMCISNIAVGIKCFNMLWKPFWPQFAFLFYQSFYSLLAGYSKMFTRLAKRSLAR